MTTYYKVLLVEDNLIAQTVGRSHLERENCQVYLASTAQAAQTLSSERQYDLILMDICLPDGNGVEITKKIRHKYCNNPNYKTPVVAVTSHFYNEEDKQACLEAGINEVLQKPLTPKMLIHVLEVYC